MLSPMLSPGATLPKSILSSPDQEERSEDATRALLKCTTQYEVMHSNAKTGLRELHENRIKSLRKELDHLKDTAWKYEPIEKYIGQSSSK